MLVYHTEFSAVFGLFMAALADSQASDMLFQISLLENTQTQYLPQIPWGLLLVYHTEFSAVFGLFMAALADSQASDILIATSVW